MEEITIGFKDKTVYEWAEVLDQPQLDEPAFLLLGFSSLVCAMLLPWWMTWLISSTAANATLELADAEFARDKYLPELEAATKDIRISFYNWKRLLEMFSGLLLKILYAFLF